MGAGRWGPPSIKKIHFFLGKNSHFFRVFFGFNFAECRALGKGFAKCPIKNTRQSWLCSHFFWRVLFVECYTRRTICRVFYAFCRVFRALGKLKESGSALDSKYSKHKDILYFKMEEVALVSTYYDWFNLLRIFPHLCQLCASVPAEVRKETNQETIYLIDVTLFLGDIARECLFGSGDRYYEVHTRDHF